MDALGKANTFYFRLSIWDWAMSLAVEGMTDYVMKVRNDIWLRSFVFNRDIENWMFSCDFSLGT